LEKHVPKALFDRPKTGFGVPLHQWLRGPIKTWGDDLLNIDALRKQNILNAELVAGRWQDFQTGRGGNANATDLWTALMFQAWHNKWMG
jgi:asparagine synthase (glutamine-hydrolysing)